MYPTMVASQALISMLASWDKGQLPNIPESFFKNRVLTTLFGIFVATLKAQNLDGSWGIGPSRETTAYALIILATSASLPLASYLSSQLCVANEAGRDFLLQHRESWSEPDYIWRAKTTYGSGVFAETYVITALAIPMPSHKLSPSVDRLCELEDDDREILLPRVRNLSIFSDTPFWLVEAALIEGNLYKLIVRQAGLDIFPRRDILSTTHIDAISFTWSASNHIKGAGMSPTMLFHMMVACLLMYELDYYMETSIAQLGFTKINGVRALIDSIFDERDSDIGSSKNGNSEISHTLHCFTNWFLQNTSVPKSSKFDQNLLKKELRVYLLTQVTSVEESLRLAGPDSDSTPAKIFSTTETFYDWIHGTSAPHVGGLLVFSFITCLLGAQQQNSQDCFPNVEANYLAQDLSAHLAALARIENDYGSVARDLKECNTNSVNFPEFSSTSADSSSALDVSAAKTKLEHVAAFERECYQMVMRRLETLVDLKISRSLQTYCNDVDLFGQLYAVDDPSPKMEQ